MAKRSPWFNARTEPPVNGGVDDKFEQRCNATPPPHNQYKRVDMASKFWIESYSCPRCQWRGLLRDPK